MTGPTQDPVQPTQGSVQRWQAYLDATVIVVTDGVVVDLTGPGATNDWPFPGDVFALTAWDPSGETRSRVTNEHNNEKLFEDLRSTGAQLWRSAGYDSHSGDFIDEGFIVSGVAIDVVVGVARRFGQEAIYRITASDLVVISTTDGYETRRPRVPQ